MTGDIDGVQRVGWFDSIRPVHRTLSRRDHDEHKHETTQDERRRHQRARMHEALRKRMLEANIDDLEHVSEIVLYDENGRAASHVGGTTTPDSSNRFKHLERSKRRFDATA